jgi:hypothetical protein
MKHKRFVLQHGKKYNIPGHIAQVQTCDYWTSSWPMSKDNVLLKDVAPFTSVQLLVL